VADQALRELIVSIEFDRIDFTRLTRLDRIIDEVERNVRDLTGDIDRMGDETRRAGDRSTRAIREIGDEADHTSDRITDLTDDIQDQGRLGAAAAAIFSNSWVLAGAAAVGAIVGVGAALVNMNDETDEIFDRMQANAGMDMDQRAKAVSSSLEVYSKGFGQDLADVAQSIGTVSSAMKDITSQEELERLTKGMLLLKDGFNSAPEVKETAKVINTMTRNFDNLSKTDALDLITYGFQQNADYADDFIDTLNEYSVYFSKIGLGAEDFLGILLKGAEAGAFNLDKVGDSIKEIGILASDSQSTAADAFKKLGFNSDDMAAKFAGGGEKGKEALMATVAALSFVDDKVKQGQIGVALFGTQWEDMRDDVIFAMDGASEAVAGFRGSTERATEILQGNVSTKWSIIWRTFKSSVIEAMEDSGLSLNGFLDSIIDRMPRIEQYVKSVVSGIVNGFDYLSTAIDQIKAGDVVGLYKSTKAYRDQQGQDVQNTKDAFGSIFAPVAPKFIGPPVAGLPASSMPSTSGGVNAPISVTVTPPIGMTKKEAQDTGDMIGKAVNDRVFSVFNQLGTQFKK
jgi:phage-related minor tail protein